MAAVGEAQLDPFGGHASHRDQVRDTITSSNRLDYVLCLHDEHQLIALPYMAGSHVLPLPLEHPCR